MNLLLISSDLNLLDSDSTVRARIRAYASAAAEQGNSLSVLMRAQQSAVIVDGPLTIYAVKVGKLRMPWVLSRYARKLITEKNIVVVSAQDPFEHGLAAMWAVRGTPAKLHIQVHTDYLSPWFTRASIFRSPQVRMPMLNKIRIRIANRVMSYAHGIRVVSERVKESLIVRYGKTIPEPVVIPLPVMHDVPSKVELPARSFTFTLIAVSRLTPEKRIPDLFAIIRRLADAYPSLGLVIVGDGPERRRLTRLAKSLGIADRVLFLGWRSDAWGLMQDAQAFIQASAYEGYGVSLLEAALAGTPIVTTDVGIVGEVFVGYEHVFAAPVGDPSNLAALVARLIEDHLARRALSLAAREAAQKHLANVKNAPADIIADLTRAANS